MQGALTLETQRWTHRVRRIAIDTHTEGTRDASSDERGSVQTDLIAFDASL